MNNHQLKELVQQVEILSKKVGAFLISQRISASDVETKAFNNLVSFVDKEAEIQFVQGLKALLPEAGFIAEEGTGDRKEGLNWIIDPLDGTTNFIHGVPVYCTSVALADGDKLLLGVIYDPNRDECFSAYHGGGASLNNHSIQVSNASALKESLLATGFPYYDFGRTDEYLHLLKELMQTTRGIRRLGSAALDLAYVACGRCDAFYEYSLHPWDVAAGIIITTEAGGRVGGFPGSPAPLFGENILASNGLIHADLESIIEKTFC
ncbi:MAG: hypothetical protein RL226_2327 [Bacteroidota bacterium]|jgi:myo-inositol-1(or 4)-monophosphatase